MRTTAIFITILFLFSTITILPPSETADKIEPTSNYGVMILRPDGVGYMSSEIHYFGGTGYVDCIDDVVPDNDTSYIYEGGGYTGSSYEFTFEDPASEPGEIVKVVVHGVVRGRDLAAGSGFHWWSLSDAGWTVWYEGGLVEYYPVSQTEYGHYHANFYLNSHNLQETSFDNSDFWTWDMIDDIVVEGSTDAYTRITQLYIEVWYVIDTESYVEVDDDYTESTPGWMETKFNTIYDAVSLCSDGGTVYVHPGTYYGDSLQKQTAQYFLYYAVDMPVAAFHCYNKSITIQGSDADSIISYHNWGNIADLRYCPNIEISNITFDGYGFNLHMNTIYQAGLFGQALGDITVENCGFYNATQNSPPVGPSYMRVYGIWLTADNIILKNLNLFDAYAGWRSTAPNDYYSYGILIDNVGENCLIQNCTIEESAIPTNNIPRLYTAIQLAISSPEAHVDIMIDSCNILNSSNGIAHGNTNMYNTTLTVQNCNIKNMYWWGYNSHIPVGERRFINNTFYNCWIQNNNAIDYRGVFSIHVDTFATITPMNLEFYDNTIDNCRQRGMYIDAINYADIHDNTIKNMVTGGEAMFFYNDSAQSYKLTDVTFNINNNTIIDTLSYGIYVRNYRSSNILIKDNDISDKNRGIYVQNCNTHLEVYNNNISWSPSGGFGIYLTTVQNSMVYGNTFSEIFGTSLALYSCSDIMIANNYFGNNSLLWGTDYYQELSSNIQFNLTKALGTNIVNGPYLGGNYWWQYPGNDTDGDYLGDTFVPWDNGEIYIADYHPLVKGYVPSPPQPTEKLIANFYWTPFYPLINETVTFYDISIGNVTTKTWSFGDGGITKTSNTVTTHIYTEEGYYDVKLSVKDETTGERDSLIKTIYIGTPIHIPPIEEPKYPDPSAFTIPEMYQLLKADRLKTTNNKVKVMILDTGIWQRTYNGISLFDVTVKYNDIYRSGIDENGHGTWCSYALAYILQKKAPNSVLISYRMLDASGGCGAQVFIDALDQALKDNVDVVSISAGADFGRPNDPISKKCDELKRAGIIVIAAAGNRGPASYTIMSPAIADSVIAIGASDPVLLYENRIGGILDLADDRICYWSSRGPVKTMNYYKPDVCAPGESIIGPWLHYTKTVSGTSMATPLIAGGAAILVAENKDLIDRIKRMPGDKSIISQAMEEALKESCYHKGNKNTWGDGIVQFDRANEIFSSKLSLYQFSGCWCLWLLLLLLLLILILYYYYRRRKQKSKKWWAK